MVIDTKLYAVLEAAPEADITALESNFRRLAVQCLPEKTRSRERFDELCWALHVLRNPERRRQYDAGGAKMVPSHDFVSSDVFGEIFGGRPRKGRRKAQDTVQELPTSLEDLYKGCTKKLSVHRERSCSKCEGSGTRNEGVSVQCTDCGGSGVRTASRQLARTYIQQVQLPCTACAGTGRIIRVDDRCSTCAGQGITREKRTFEVRVRPGMQSGEHFAFQGEGDHKLGCELPGDVIVILSEKRHPRFVRQGDHLLYTHELSLVEALCGFVMVVEHLDGRQLCIQPALGQVISPNQLWQVEGEGMVVPGTGGAERGHLLLQFRVDFPARLSEANAQQICQILGQRPRPMVSADCVKCWLRPTELGALDHSAPVEQAGGGGLSRRSGECAHQ